MCVRVCVYIHLSITTPTHPPTDRPTHTQPHASTHTGVNPSPGRERSGGLTLAFPRYSCISTLFAYEPTLFFANTAFVAAPPPGIAYNMAQ